jgi:hypothetical protein
LYQQLQRYPQEMIPIFDMVANQIFDEKREEREEFDDGTGTPPRAIQTRPYHLKEITNMRDLNPSDIDQLITVSGMITRVGGIVPDLKQGRSRLLCLLRHLSLPLLELLVQTTPLSCDLSLRPFTSCAHFCCHALLINNLFYSSLSFAHQLSSSAPRAEPPARY